MSSTLEASRTASSSSKYLLVICAPSLPARCIPVSSSLGTSQRSRQLSPCPTLFQGCPGILGGSASVGLGLIWRVSRAHTQSRGPAGRARLSRIIRLGVSRSFLKGVDIMSSREGILEPFLHLSERRDDRCMNLTTRVAKLIFSLNVFSDCTSLMFGMLDLGWVWWNSVHRYCNVRASSNYFSKFIETSSI